MKNEVAAGGSDGPKNQKKKKNKEELEPAAIATYTYTVEIVHIAIARRTHDTKTQRDEGCVHNNMEYQNVQYF